MVDNHAHKVIIVPLEHQVLGLVCQALTVQALWDRQLQIALHAQLDTIVKVGELKHQWFVMKVGIVKLHQESVK